LVSFLILKFSLSPLQSLRPPMCRKLKCDSWLASQLWAACCSCWCIGESCPPTREKWDVQTRNKLDEMNPFFVQ
jgi:hypothetical protein